MPPAVDVAKSEPLASPVRSRLQRLQWWVLARLNIIGLAATLLIMGVLFSSLSPYFLTVRNLLNIGRAVSIRGIVAAGLTLVLITGGIDLSIGSNMAATGMLIAFMLRAGWPVALAVLAGIAFGAALGLITSFFVTKVGINPLITTLGMMSIVRGLGYVVSEGVSISLPGDSVLPVLSRGRVLGIPNPLILWLAICLLCYLLLKYTRVGQYIFAIGGNENACRVAGVRVNRVKTLTYVLCASLAGFGGVLLTSLGGGASPTNAMGTELDIVASVVLGGISLSGGTGSIVGTVLGTLVLGTINNGLTLIGMRSYWQVAVRGAILMLAVTLDVLRTGGVHRRG